MFVLTKPREALGQVDAAPSRRAGTPGSAPGQPRRASSWRCCWTALAWVENFLECRGWTSLVAADRLVLGPIFAAAGTRREVRGRAEPATWPWRWPSHERHLIHEIVALFHGGASMRRIARSLQCQPPHCPAGARAGRTGPRHRPTAARTRDQARAGQPARRLRSGDRRPAGALSRHHGPADPRGIAPARLHGGLHDPLPSGCGGCVLGRSSRPCGGSRPPRATGTNGLFHV